MRQRKQAIIVVPVMGMEGEGDIVFCWCWVGLMLFECDWGGRKDWLEFVGMTTGVFCCLNC